MLLHDATIRPTGRFVLNVYRGGRLIEHIDEPNLVLTSASQINALLAGGTVTGNSVATIGYGTNGTAPVVGNTALTGAYTKALDGVTFPGGGQAAFAFSLGSGEANGVAIIEFGLLTTAGVLYARKTRSAALFKASDISFSGTWTLQF